MNGLRLPLRLTAAALAGFLVFAAVTWAQRSTLRSVREALTGLDPVVSTAVLDEIGRGFLLPGFAAVAAATLMAWWLGGAVARDLARLRTLAIARARGREVPPLATPFVEVKSAAAAVDRLAADLAEETAALRRERAELALQLNSVSEGIIQLDPEGRVVHANPAARRLLGLPSSARGEALAAHVRNAEIRALLRRLAGDEAAPFTEATLQERRLLVAGHRLPRPDDGEEPGAVLGVVDLTEIRRLEGVRRDFVANVSHELKTPLTSIRGYAETLRSDPDMDAEMRLQFLDTIQRNADRLHHIVDDLLDLSRLESGGWRPELQRVRALKLAEDAWLGCREAAKRKRLTFTVAGPDMAVLADPGGLRQVLANLLENAVRYTPEGGRITVSLSRAEHPVGVRGTRGDPAEALRLGPDPEARPTGSWLALDVVDTGVGIPRDQLTRIFERFYRVDPARSRADGGTGLGLSIVKHLVESMGGQVVATSEFGKGTTMRVRLRGVSSDAGSDPDATPPT